MRHIHLAISIFSFAWDLLLIDPNYLYYTLDLSLQKKMILNVNLISFKLMEYFIVIEAKSRLVPVHGGGCDKKLKWVPPGSTHLPALKVFRHQLKIISLEKDASLGYNHCAFW